MPWDFHQRTITPLPSCSFGSDGILWCAVDDRFIDRSGLSSIGPLCCKKSLDYVLVIIAMKGWLPKLMWYYFAAKFSLQKSFSFISLPIPTQVSPQGPGHSPWENKTLPSADQTQPRRGSTEAKPWKGKTAIDQRWNLLLGPGQKVLTSCAVRMTIADVVSWIFP